MSKVLYVDDELELLEQVSEIVVASGFEVLTAGSVDQALEIVEAEANHLVLILSDYAMNGKNGFDLRKSLLDRHREIPFVLISGNILMEDALRAVELKIAAFVSKPFREEDLIKTIQKESAERVASLKEDAELLTGFITDANALVEEMESLVLSLEDQPDDAVVLNRIFACAHTVKGASGFFKPDTIHKYTHRYEDFFSTYKKYPEKINPNVISILLKGIDLLKSLLEQLRTSKPMPALEELITLFDGNVEGDASAVDVPKEQEKAIAVSAKATKKTEEIRVNLTLLDDFMEKSGEITVLRNMIHKVLHAIEIKNSTDPNVPILSDLLSEMHKVISSMQDQLEDLRKVPLRQVFKPLSRTARDLCVGLKKKINFETLGEDLRIDHTLAETLNKCLIHMVRNSADHGVELPEQRVQLGKPETGTIKIACTEGRDDVTVRMSDDGRGIDPQRIRNKAIEKGIIGPIEANKLTDAAARMLIFEPGFSTSEEVTDVSGRGVGTDMVKTTIESIGGHIKLDSEIGKGTVFSLVLPIPKSVLIINALIIKIGDFVLAIPQEKIIRVVKASLSADDRFRRIGSALLFDDGANLIPIIGVDSVLGLGQALDFGHDPLSDQVGIIVVQSKGGLFCLRVDEILDVEEIVVKKIGKWFNQLKIYAGATFFGDGRVGLILDTDGISERVHLHASLKAIESSGIEIKKDSQSRSFLLFQLASKTTYAIPQSDLFRLEELDASQIQKFGSHSVIIYRDQTMPIIDLGSVLNEMQKITKKSECMQRERLPTIVILHKNRFVGLVVDQIGDFIEQSGEVGDSYPFDAISSTVIIKEQTITVLNVEHILDMLDQAPGASLQVQM